MIKFKPMGSKRRLEEIERRTPSEETEENNTTMRMSAMAMQRRPRWKTTMWLYAGSPWSRKQSRVH